MIAEDFSIGKSELLELRLTFMQTGIGNSRFYVGILTSIGLYHLSSAMEDNEMPLSLLIRELRRLQTENARLRTEVRMLREQAETASTMKPAPPEQTTEQQEVTPELAGFFFSVFRGRADVFSRRVVRKDGKAAYYPACSNFWKSGVCPRCSGETGVKCAVCAARAWAPITKRILMQHLQGGTEAKPVVLGVYPLLEDETCHFLVFDFDSHDENPITDWRAEVDALRAICRLHHVPAYAERSRSGRGAHVWFFFQEALPAELARRFGTALLTKGAESVNQRSFVSYDRMLPTQDRLPDGGLGNLIALPLQGLARQQGNSVFIDEEWHPIPDQWALLRERQKISKAFVEEKIREWIPDGLLGVLGFSAELADTTDGPWNSPTSTLHRQDVNGSVQLVMADHLWIRKANLRPRLQNRLRRMAAFSNPKYGENLRLKLSNYRTPRIIPCFEETEEYLGLPRGIAETLDKQLREAGIPVQVEDKRSTGEPFPIRFAAELYPEQQEAANALLEHENGILSAATAFGKTAVGAYLVGARRVSTLILVHNREIMKNWVEDLGRFLCWEGELPTYRTKSGRERRRKSPIGCLFAGHDSRNGRLDVAMFTSLAEEDPRLKQYGLVIMDECHHAAAATAEMVLSSINARWVYGLTATPKRDDRMEPKMLMQLGPIRYRFTARQRAEMQGVQHYVYPRFTSLVQLGEALKIHDAYEAAIHNARRNALIIKDVEDAVTRGRTPLVLTRFRTHADTLYELLAGKVQHRVLLTGGRSTKERDALRAELAAIPPMESAVIIATGQYIGEGFNFPRLDTLMLAAPIAWEGNVEQYAGRLHRDYRGKQEVIIYDYVDIHVAVFEKMYHKRVRAYRKIGYALCEGASLNSIVKKMIYAGDEYKRDFETDISSAGKQVIISSPGLNAAGARWIQELSLTLQVRGIALLVLTLAADAYPESRRGAAAALLEQLRSGGINTMALSRLHLHFVLIDAKTVWFGSTNILSRSREDDTIIRVQDTDLAQDLQMSIRQQTETTSPQQSYLALNMG